ncbi:MAG: hypothetical protein A8274_888 [Halanaerobium sp. 4-GBenrich]|jgi:hypothetical protein|uniref:Beta-barrel porin 2 n=1 Tax=Halanaerobium congolense TaxID=54121 RepID=A0A1G6LUS1_9FIRM|nr:DUF1302 family protein [Halanaerobium congolense]KXS49083.1 MAG: hypothetical protein AWL62_1379 [Halanaerobium sp. T82-1]ODS50154.1 MAG: hypothetical protein A8274_888 [Halanaerobium sp. 4-GBenrich]PUU91864.1 MAG: hypothetical protein CI948_957 [Halanaerobium sp.]PXV67327.1 hypothetical protein C8C78_10872 [Halanaerobium congolense]TDP16345.1 hypothetical protein C8C79_11654 [Halanaerobium congolense]
MKRKVFKSLVFSMLIILCLAIPAAAFDGGGFYESEVEELEDEALDITGELEPEFRIFSDDGEIDENLTGNLKFSYPGKTHEFKVLIDFQPGAVEEIEFNELYYRYFGKKYNFLIGKHVTIWGKGDKVHVVDNLNAEDMSDFINPEYKDRQIGEEMIKIDRYFRGGNANLEFVYTPDFTPNRLAEDPESPLGNWVINPFTAQLSDLTLRKISTATNQTEAEVISQVKDAAADEDNQFGLRFTDSRGGTDYGLSYYNGYLRTPGYDKAALNAKYKEFKAGNSTFSSVLEAADLHYDSVDVFGFELARVIADINSRFELAYYRTDDTAGDDPTVRNNKIAWVIGGDRDLPISNLNLNLQFTGEKILDDDQIENNILQGSNVDAEYDEDGDYTTNRAILKLEDSYQNEKIIPELTWIYNLNDNDYILEAAVDYELEQDLILTFAHKIFRGDQDTTFGQFEDNDFSSFSLKYSF